MIQELQEEAHKLANYNKEFAKFFKCDYNVRKTAKKTGDVMTFTHLVETTMIVQDFSSDRFFGCEFVKAESGFNCRLCNLHIKTLIMWLATLIVEVTSRCTRTF